MKCQTVSLFPSSALGVRDETQGFRNNCSCLTKFSQLTHKDINNIFEIFSLTTKITIFSSVVSSLNILTGAKPMLKDC